MSPKFSLQPVLDYRHHRVELLEVELGRLLLEKQRSQIFLQALLESRDRLMEQLAHSQQGEMDLFLVSRQRSSLKTVIERVVQQEARLQELDHQVQFKREEMVATRQDEEALAILKEKERIVYQQEQAQQENRLQDDIYIAQAYRRSVSTVP